jgi:hypothetical protein
VVDAEKAQFNSFRYFFAVRLAQDLFHSRFGGLDCQLNSIYRQATQKRGRSRIINSGKVAYFWNALMYLLSGMIAFSAACMVAYIQAGCPIL